MILVIITEHHYQYSILDLEATVFSRYVKNCIPLEKSILLNISFLMFVYEHGNNSSEECIVIFMMKILLEFFF